MHTDLIHCVRIISDKWILSGSSDCTWCIHERSPCGDYNLKSQVKHNHGILGLVASSDLNFVLTYDDSGSVLVYKSKLDSSYELIQTIVFGPKRVHSISLSPENILAIGTSDKLLRLYALQNGSFAAVLSFNGHTNWITDMNWSPLISNGHRYLSTCGPDKTVRIWALKANEESPKSPILTELIPKKTSFELNGKAFILENESILYGHEGMVNSCRWAVDMVDGCQLDQVRLITSSTDHTLIVWSPNADNTSWNSVAHIGDISGSSTIGTDRSFGFYSGILFTDLILTHGSKGDVQFWNLHKDSNNWKPDLPLTGHFKSIEGCSWDPEGNYLLTTSLDQTTRIFCPNLQGSWHEIARPQIHGYDLHCISAIDESTFISGADEKVLRVFKAPDNFTTRLNIITGKAGLDIEIGNVVPTFVPALGLSNRTDSFNQDEQSTAVSAQMPLGSPPSESDLCRHTLWPEIDKLYGHGNELYSVALHPSKVLAASSAKANLSADAGIRFWSKTETTWLMIGHLEVHSLTVISLRFSPSGKYLLATSRDRSWSLIEIIPKEDGGWSFNLIRREEAHSRIIWASVWESNDSFITVSRDKKVKAWTCNPFALVQTLELENGATSVDFMQCSNGTKYLAVGQENGQLTIFSKVDAGWMLHETSQVCSDSINQVSWRPNVPELACISQDRSLRIFKLS